MRFRRVLWLCAMLLIALPPLRAFQEDRPAGSPTAAEAQRKASTEANGSAHGPLPTVSPSDISAAKASGKVWVNTQTGVYHKGGKWYGATKHGKFMTEQEAVQAGYRASKSK